MAVKIWIVFFYFFSGFAALTYEILWSRLLVLLTGNSTLSITLILCIFMAGLGSGSAIFGRLHKGNPIKTYGVLEIAIGLYSLLFFYYHADLYELISTNIEWLKHTFVQKGTIVFLLLFIPTFLMGATFPVIMHFFTDTSPKRGFWVGMIYGVNTIGSMFGAAITGYLLIQYLGLEYTNLFAVMINLIIGIMCLILPLTHKTQSREPLQNLKINFSFTLCLLLSGSAAMLYEVVWSRTLTLVIGSSTYAFTVILITFLAGIGFGSLFFGILVDKVRDSMSLFAICQFIAAATSIASYLFVNKLPLFFYYIFDWSSLSIWKYDIIHFILCFIILFIPCFALGASIPVLSKNILHHHQRTAPLLGKLYFINSVGAFLGIFVTGLYLIPYLGSTYTLWAGILINLFLCIIGFLKSQQIRRSIKYFIMVSGLIIACAGTWLLPPWNKTTLSSGISIYAQTYKNQGLTSENIINELNKTKILYAKEGWSANVTVKEYANVRSLLINGKADGSNGLDKDSELMAAHLPLILHKNPKSVFLLGLGTGITLSAIESWPVDRIVCSEIEPRVVEASQYFQKDHHGALNDPRLTLIIDDARHILAMENKRYDIIISEPSNPWLAGINHLFTREMFQIHKNRLNKNGIICQWIHYYNLQPEDLKSVIETFREVFPNSSLWIQPHLSDMFLIGINSDSAPSLDHLNKLFNQKNVIERLEPLSITDLPVFLSLHFMDSNALKSYSEGAQLNTDYFPIVEYRAPRSLYADTLKSNLVELMDHRRPFPEKKENYKYSFKAMGNYFKSILYRYQDRPDQELIALFKAAKVLPEYSKMVKRLRTLAYRKAQIFFELKKPKKALNLLLKIDQIIAYCPRIRYTIGYLLQSQEDLNGAIDYYLKALDDNPDFQEAWNNIGVAYLKLGEYDEEAYESFNAALEINPHYLEAHINLANTLMRMHKYTEAELEFRSAHKIRPQSLDILNSLGISLSLQQKFPVALNILTKGYQIDSKNKKILNSMAQVYSKIGNLKQAKRYYEKSLKVDPLQFEIRSRLRELNDPLMPDED